MKPQAPSFALAFIVAIMAASPISKAGASETEELFSIGPLTEITGIGSFDSWCMSAYSRPVDMASEAFTCAVMAFPVALLAAPREDWASLGTMYAESLLLTWGLKELGKAFFARERPYMYFDGYPQDELKNGEYLESFPSGHAALAFTGASFFSFALNRYLKDSPWRIPLTAVSFACATAASALRVGSGNHFPSDVVVGAAIGVVSGFMVPWLHSLNAK